VWICSCLLVCLLLDLNFCHDSVHATQVGDCVAIPEQTPLGVQLRPALIRNIFFLRNEERVCLVSWLRPLNMMRYSRRHMAYYFYYHPTIKANLPLVDYLRELALDNDNDTNASSDSASLVDAGTPPGSTCTNPQSDIDADSVLAISTLPAHPVFDKRVNEERIYVKLFPDAPFNVSHFTVGVHDDIPLPLSSISHVRYLSTLIRLDDNFVSFAHGVVMIFLLLHPFGFIHLVTATSSLFQKLDHVELPTCILNECKKAGRARFVNSVRQTKHSVVPARLLSPAYSETSRDVA
jgi:hypothetical protein